MSACPCSNLAAAAAALDQLGSPLDLARQRTDSISLTAGLSAAPGELDDAAAAAAGGDGGGSNGAAGAQASAGSE